MDNYEIIGVDMTTEGSKDLSVVTCICGQCRTVIAKREYRPEINEIDVPFFIKCPYCGIKFKKHISMEDIKYE